MGRGTKIGLASAIMGTALVGGFLVRAHDRNERRAEETMAPPAEPSAAPVAPVVAAPPVAPAWPRHR